MSTTSYTSSFFTKTKIAEQGWVTAGAWPLPAHRGQEIQGGNILPRGGAGVNDIAEGDLLYSYKNVENLNASSCVTSNSGETTVFSNINGMNTLQPITFIGVATTEHRSGSGEDLKLGLTMSGTVTIKKYSFHAFKKGDLVAWSIPAPEDKNSGTWCVPRIEEDLRCGRIRPVLYPVRMDAKEAYSDNMVSVIRNATVHVTDNIKLHLSNGSDQDAGRAPATPETVLDAITEMLTSAESTFKILNVIGHCTDDKKIDATALVDALRQDLWDLLSYRLNEGRCIPEMPGSISEVDSIYLAVLLTFAIKQFVRAFPEFEAVVAEGDPLVYGKDTLSMELFLVEFDANVTYELLRFLTMFTDSRSDKKRHHIIGMAMNASTPHGLDIWIGRK